MFQPIFKSNLLRLASPTGEDQDVFSRWTEDDVYMRPLDDDPVRPLNSAYYASFSEPSKQDDYYFHLRTLDADHLIGFVVLFNIKWRNQSAELAIGIGDAHYRGKGYGQDALKLILHYGFSELNLHRVGLTVLSYNESAIKAYERAGFQREGIHRQAIQRDGQRYDLLLYGILRDELQKLG